MGKGEVNTTMKYSLVLVFILGASAGQPTPAPAKSAAKAETPKSGAVTLPASAVEIEPNYFKYTDKAGKTTYYRRSPLGIAYAQPPEKKASSSTATASNGEIQAYDQGDSVKFVRPGPFGLYTWIRKKSELNDDEKVAFEKIKVTSESAKTQPATPKSTTRKEQ